ncbi:hypothetical protein HT031_002013 [Scenedesmus sp. PABB004]|nr:hypothetical protein HT031_002013 [Scenedesmus sp. PABB004]
MLRRAAQARAAAAAPAGGGAPRPRALCASRPAGSPPGRARAVRVAAFAAEQPATAAPALQPGRAAAYLVACATPLSRQALQMYAAQEGLLDQLIATPDLDKRLAAGDAGARWAAAAVEGAVAAAVGVAFRGESPARAASPAASPTWAAGPGSGSSSSSPQPSPLSTLDAFARMADWSDGMGAVGAARASGGAAAPAAAPRGAPTSGGGAAAAGGCPDDGDDGCEVDWDALFGAEAATGDGERAPLAGRGSSLGSADGLAAAGGGAVAAATGEAPAASAAHLFLQRTLYKINRLSHFWYDDLAAYANERSLWLAALRESIEEPWQAWEAGQMADAAAAECERAGGPGDLAAPLAGAEAYRALTPEQIKQALRARFARDVDPPLSRAQEYVANEMGPLGYAHLLAVGSVDGLVEASRQSRVCAGAANEVSCAIFRVLMEEYGGGRLPRKHSTFYKTMMAQLGLDTREEGYLSLLPWAWLAGANANFLLTERRAHYLRYAGALTFFEINGPSTYLAAARRCGLGADVGGYWELHIKEDERHGRQCLEDVALPLVDLYPRDAWQLLLGYDQDRFMGGRAGAALVAHIQAAEALHQEAARAAQRGGGGRAAAGVGAAGVGAATVPAE